MWSFRPSDEDQRRKLETQKKENEFHRFVDGHLVLKQGLVDKRKVRCPCWSLYQIYSWILRYEYLMGFNFLFAQTCPVIWGGQNSLVFFPFFFSSTLPRLLCRPLATWSFFLCRASNQCSIFLSVSFLQAVHLTSVCLILASPSHVPVPNQNLFIQHISQNDSVFSRWSSGWMAPLYSSSHIPDRIFIYTPRVHSNILMLFYSRSLSHRYCPYFRSEHHCWPNLDRFSFSGHFSTTQYTS